MIRHFRSTPLKI